MAQTPDIVLASDAHGVVFWPARMPGATACCNPLSDEERRE